ncbi:MAG: peptidase M16 [Hydrogenophilales bacterium 16-64-46]|nr:MAG: peptidase M16 [Hydrogenophilales bacterium 12-64-13]OYZ07282.1 MAG: peptidase M16 [Hydrogenophilales bacterium 16-64-46]OZA37251.1 MAG: peptidase M16 [Hydrogenophilales bacterium 17-64-34]HQS99001.1 pitrilysin family protein [Thiobacillus sp.]
MRSLWALLLAGIATMAQAGITDVTLDNGMRVIVQEDARAPVMVSQVWYRAGSLDEFNGTTGVAHVLEHMMFKGTKEVPPGEFSRRIAAAGGRENAFTSRDHTAYFQQMQRDRLELSMKLEADRMANLVISDELFAKEIQVVMEERRLRTDDQPQSVVYERLMATAYQTHPYRRPIIGWMDDLQNMTAQDARDWYARWYAPNNATLVVAGDVKADEVIALAKKYFGPIPAKALPERKPQTEVEQLGGKRLVVKAPAKLPYLLMAWHAPTLRDWQKDTEPYALQILMGVLSGNDSARLSKSLVKTQQVAVNASAGYDTVARGPGMVLVDATPAQGKTVADVEKAIRAEIARIQKDGISAAELARVQAQVIAADVYQRDSLFFQAMQLGEYVMAGLPPEALSKRVERLRAVTVDDVRAAAQKWLVDDRLSIATLDPQPLEARAPRAAVAGARHVN